MIGAQTAASDELVILEDRTRGLLAGEPVTTAMYVWYLDFAREVYRLVKHFSGGYGLIHEVALLIHKWKERGCSEPVLIRIRDDIFGLQPVSAP